MLVSPEQAEITNRNVPGGKDMLPRQLAAHWEAQASPFQGGGLSVSPGPRVMQSNVIGGLQVRTSSRSVTSFSQRPSNSRCTCTLVEREASAPPLTTSNAPGCG